MDQKSLKMLSRGGIVTYKVEWDNIFLVRKKKEQRK